MNVYFFHQIYVNEKIFVHIFENVENTQITNILVEMLFITLCSEAFSIMCTPGKRSVVESVVYLVDFKWRCPSSRLITTSIADQIKILVENKEREKGLSSIQCSLFIHF